MLFILLNHGNPVVNSVIQYLAPEKLHLVIPYNSLLVLVAEVVPDHSRIQALLIL
jgi:hypothetical protein